MDSIYYYTDFVYQYILSSGVLGGIEIYKDLVSGDVQEYALIRQPSGHYEFFGEKKDIAINIFIQGPEAQNVRTWAFAVFDLLREQFALTMDDGNGNIVDIAKIEADIPLPLGQNKIGLYMYSLNLMIKN